VQAKATFRVTDKQPELWNPETGAIIAVKGFQSKDGATTIPLQFEPNESTFVVFRNSAVGGGKAAAEVPSPGNKINISEITGP